jgi:endonuclease-3
LDVHVFKLNTGQQGKTMGTAKATKAADKSQVCRKLVGSLQKLYGKSVPRIELSVVETMLFAVCLEDNPWGLAETSLKNVLGSYFDLNEIRVSSVSELEQTLAPLRDADWKGLRIRSVLRYVFETTYSYDFEKLRRQTLEQAVKTLKKVNDITPFIRDFLLHEILGSHVVCLDTSMLTASRWLGLVPENADLFEASEYLKGGLKKSEVSEFCHLLRCLATDPRFIPRFADPPEAELSMDDVMDRLTELQSPPKKKVVKPAPVVETVKADKLPAAKKASGTATTDKSAVGKSAPVNRTPTPAKAVAVTTSKTTHSGGKSSEKTATPKTGANGKAVSGTSSKSAPAKPAPVKKATEAAAKPAAKKPKK